MLNRFSPLANSISNRQTLSLRETIHNEIAKSEKNMNSPLGRVLHYWQGNPKMRIAVGLGLLSGGMIATATGAFATAGIILGTRASISALGAFTGSKGLYDLVRGRKQSSEMERLLNRAKWGGNIEELEPILTDIESRYSDSEIQTQLKIERNHAITSNIIGVTAAAVAGILALQGGEEILSSQMQPSNETLSTIVPKWIPPGLAPKLPTYNLEAIAGDIRQDHPKQWWITLEQMVRRVEGLRMGIDLNHSEKLSVMNESISKIVHEPDGMIAQAMKHRGYEMKDGIDTASRHLSENEIKGIVEEYIQNTEIPTVMENEVPILETQLELPLEPPMEPTEIPTERNEHSNWIFAKITGIGALVGGAWFWKNRLWKKEKSNLGNGEIQSIATVPTDSDTLVEHSEVIPETSEIARPENPVETESNTPTNPWEIPTISPVSEITTPFRLSESAETAKQKIHSHFTENYSWIQENDECKTTENQQVDVYSGTTLGWHYRIYVVYSEIQMQITIVWYDHDAARSYVQSAQTSYESILHPTNPESWIEYQMDELYFEMLTQREKIKSEDMKDVLSVSIPKSYLQAMYQHMEQPEIRIPNSEVQWYWLASTYNIQNHTLPIDALDNPPLQDQIYTMTSCRLKDLALQTQYYFAHPNRMIFGTLPPTEAKMITRKREIELAKWKQLVFTGASRLLNWHKHPDGITGPSSGDISEAIRDINVQCPGLETHPYTIAVRIQERQIASLSLDPKVCVLKKSDYGGEYSYAFRTYNMVFDGKNYTGLQQWDIKIE